MNKTLKIKEAGYNDERIKLVNDMVVGARTIKCYAWEKFYIDKISAARNMQEKYVFWQGFVGTLGISVF